MPRPRLCLDQACGRLYVLLVGGLLLTGCSPVSEEPPASATIRITTGVGGLLNPLAEALEAALQDHFAAKIERVGDPYLLRHARLIEEGEIDLAIVPAN